MKEESKGLMAWGAMVTVAGASMLLSWRLSPKGKFIAGGIVATGIAMFIVGVGLERVTGTRPKPRRRKI